MSRSLTSSPAAASPTPESERLLAPDLARGVMLLLIALAHSRMLHAGGNALAAPAGGGPLDVAVQWILTSFVDGRAAPLFGLLFGYGLVQMTRRRTGPDGDTTAARRIIRRRGAWLVVFGIAHVVLLYSGDVIGSYGVMAVLFAGAVSWSARRLWVVAAAGVVVGAVLVAPVLALAETGGTTLAVGETLLDSLLLRTVALPIMPIAAITGLAPMLLGIMAGRMRVLEEPLRNRTLLRRVAMIGLPLAVLGAQPVSLQAVGLWAPDSAFVNAAGFAVFAVTGIAGGLGYAALIALVALRMGDRRGPVTTALVATGRRSMTFYIAQSPVWFVLTEPALLDLGQGLGAAAAAGVATATWAATVVIAALLHRTGRRGPAEALLRRLTYGPRSRRPAPAQPAPGGPGAGRPADGQGAPGGGTRPAGGDGDPTAVTQRLRAVDPTDRDPG